MSSLNKFSQNMRSGRDLEFQEAEELFLSLLASTDTNLIRDILEVWSQKGTTSTELQACCELMRKNMIRVQSTKNPLLDIVGTGGSSAKLFNISTAAAFVAAGAGVCVAKHGNRAASSKTGSADALSSLGVNIESDPVMCAAILEELGICFMFAPKFHNLTKEIADARRAFGRPTAFNQIGPLANPASAPYQLIGVWSENIVKPMAKAIARLGTKKTWIVHGKDGLDELSLSGETMICEIDRDSSETFQVTPEDFGFRSRDIASRGALTPASSAKIVESVLIAEDLNSAEFDIVALNAAAAIYVSGEAATYREASVKAIESLKSGSAKKKLDGLIERTKNG